MKSISSITLCYRMFIYLILVFPTSTTSRSADFSMTTLYYNLKDVKFKFYIVSNLALRYRFFVKYINKSIFFIIIIVDVLNQNMFKIYVIVTFCISYIITKITENLLKCNYFLWSPFRILEIKTFGKSEIFVAAY